MKWENEHDEFVARYVEQNPDDHVDLSAFFLFGYFKGRFDIDFIKRKIKIWRDQIVVRYIEAHMTEPPESTARSLMPVLPEFDFSFVLKRVKYWKGIP
ncbi:uncharacterized protein YALI1_D29595g [Yarrowia lipolytica]|uniref:Uncharacterized protein n=1 Tax=Yarrowia lipolytica TaxID=4952 RepID=A0A1D8NFT7_YARLL|nr:hypothetical protein YALI1_D29595g [Yarrowia lipolytica]